MLIGNSQLGPRAGAPFILLQTPSHQTQPPTPLSSGAQSPGDWLPLSPALATPPSSKCSSYILAATVLSVDSASLYPVTAVAIMEMDVTSDTVEVLPQHKFDVRSLEAYLNQNLPGFGADPWAVLTVTQYRYLSQPLPSAGTSLCLVLFFFWHWVGFSFVQSRLVSLQGRFSCVASP